MASLCILIRFKFKLQLNYIIFDWYFLVHTYRYFNLEFEHTCRNILDDFLYLFIQQALT